MTPASPQWLLVLLALSSALVSSKLSDEPNEQSLSDLESNPFRPVLNAHLAQVHPTVTVNADQPSTTPGGAIFDVETDLPDPPLLITNRFRPVHRVRELVASGADRICELFADIRCHRFFPIAINALAMVLTCLFLPFIVLMSLFSAFYNTSLRRKFSILLLMSSFVLFGIYIAEPSNLAPCHDYLPSLHHQPFSQYYLEAPMASKATRNYMLKDGVRNRTLYQFYHRKAGSRGGMAVSEAATWDIYQPLPDHQYEEESELPEFATPVGRMFTPEFDDAYLVVVLNQSRHGVNRVELTLKGSFDDRYQLLVNGSSFLSSENWWKRTFLQKAPRLTFRMPKRTDQGSAFRGPLGVVISRSHGYRICVPGSEDSEDDVTRGFALGIAAIAWER